MSKHDHAAHHARRKKIKMTVGWAVGLGVVGAIMYVLVTAPRVPASEYVSTTGLHYHPHLSITVNGEKVVIPNNVGLGVTHNPIHTHDEGDGVIHLEFEGKVKKEDTQLGDFFTVWGKEWTATSFMGLPIDDNHTLTMKVNGTPSTEYGNLLMQDKQEITLDYK